MESPTESLAEEGVELYSHHGVLTQDLNLNRDDDSLCSGTLFIKKYSYGTFIEWIQIEEKALSVESQDQGWAVVNPVKARTQNSTDSTETCNTARVRPLKVDITDLKSYKISKQSHELTLMLKDGSRPSPLLFQNDNADKFVTSLQQYVQVVRSPKEKNLFCVMGLHDEKLTKSFAELDLSLQNTLHSGWSFLGSFHNNPYETTMTAFSKVAGIVLHHGVQALNLESGNIEDMTKHLIQLRMSSLDAAAKVDEYEIIYPSYSNKLPPRPTVKRGSPVTLEEWAKHFDDDGRMINIKELKEKIFRGGISPILRYDAWKFLLDYMPSTATREEWQEIRKRKVEEYIQMKHQWKSMTADQESRFSYFRERKNLIEKDVNRTDRTIPYFEGNDNPNVQLLYDILMTYVMYNFDLGYVQGMSDLLSPILYLMENEVDAFWCFVGFMNKMSNNFEMDQTGIKQQLKNLNILIRFIDRELGNYLESNESDNLFFCFRWLLILFKREFSYQDIMVLWEVLWSDLPGPNFHLFICLAILDTERDVLIANEYGFTEILKHINDLSLHINLQDVLIRAEAIYLQLLAAEDLPDSVKVILNLPVTECRNDSESTEELVVPPTSDHLSNGEPSQSESMEPSEQMYEQALSLHM